MSNTKLEKWKEENEGVIAIADDISRKNKLYEIDKLMGEISELDNQLLKLKQHEIFAQINALSTARQEIMDKINELAAKEGVKMLGDKDYGCGTANFETDLFKIKTVVSKKVKWDEKVLRAIAGKIREAGQDPEVYIQYKLNVTETAYKGFPEKIQKEFEPARTVEPSKPAVTIERK